MEKEKLMKKKLELMNNFSKLKATEDNYKQKSFL